MPRAIKSLLAWVIVAALTRKAAANSARVIGPLEPNSPRIEAGSKSDGLAPL
jgi:hypothetical protein